jgi:4-methylaminobutanoate oxidase (formaldehyde-forming)
VEAGLVFATALKGDKDFLGRTALEAHRERLAQGGPRRRIASFVVADPGPMLWGGELIVRNGATAGQVTSAAWGETVGSSVGLALLRGEGPITGADLAEGGFEVDVAGVRYALDVSLTAPLK